MATYEYTIHNHDVLIIGAGGAGLRAAIAAADKGASVACISKVPPTRSHTVAAQGGINAALGNRVEDNWQWHMYDTIRGADWLADQDAVAFMCEHAPAAILELDAMGMPFTRDENGQIYQRAYGGQHTDFGKGGPAYRACAVADRTGHSLLHTLYGQAVRQKVEFFSEFMALDLVFDDENICRGLLAWELATGELHLFQAHSTVIATGGFGQAYASTTASSICTGDGGGMVLRAGLPLQDMEFVQFHPTGLYGTGLLITEGARGEGAILLNKHGERFMERYAPHGMELASRDVIARAMTQEILEGRGCGKDGDHLHLSLTHLDKNVIDTKLPSIRDIAKTFARIDVEKEYIPVLPTVHYTMGGIPTNVHGEVIHGLYAIGEAACTSVHGANRLGCNSLLELVVFGKSVGTHAALHAKKAQAHKPIQSHQLEPSFSRLEAFSQSRGGSKTAAIRKELQHAMQTHAGIFRTYDLLEEGQQKLRQLWKKMQEDLLISDTSRIWNNEMVGALETDNLLRQATVAIACALERTESRGAHWRQDYPARDDTEWLTHSLGAVDDNGNVRHSTTKVRMNYTEPKTQKIKSVPPEDRVY
ncbi:MAG: succinate dehydrogenase flavoprotein subunit [Alphaproteobacteria bacterium]